MNDNNQTKRRFVAKLSKTALCLAVALGGSLVTSQSFAMADIDHQTKKDKDEPQHVIVPVVGHNEFDLGSEYDAHANTTSDASFLQQADTLTHMGNTSGYISLVFDSNQQEMEKMAAGSVYGAYDAGFFSASAEVSAYESSQKNSADLNLTFLYKIDGKKVVLGADVLPDEALDAHWLAAMQTDVQSDTVGAVTGLVGVTPPLVYEIPTDQLVIGDAYVKGRTLGAFLWLPLIFIL